MLATTLLALAGFAPAADAPDPVRKDLDNLKGTWVLVSATIDGKKASAEQVRKTRITFAGDRFAFPDDAELGTSKMGTITIDPSKTPKEMDSTDVETKKTSPGIYEINGDDYRVCFAPPGKKRPTAFASAPGTAIILQVWKRAKR